MKKIFYFPLLLILICSLMSWCKKNGTAPTLPPAESMTIDFSNFVPGKKSLPANYETKAVENTNWTVAATVVHGQSRQARPIRHRCSRSTGQKAERG